MRSRILWLLAVTAVCVAMATPAQADYASEVTTDSPFLWMKLDETSVTNLDAAVNSGSTGIGGTYHVNANGNFIDVTSPVGPAKDFNVINFGGVLEPDIALADQGGYYALTAYTVEFLLNPTAYAGEQMIYGSEGAFANAAQVGMGTSAAGYGVYPTVGGQSHITFDISALASVGAWSHVVLTNSISDNGDGTSTSDIDVYVNGVRAAGAEPVWTRTLAGQGTATFGNVARMGDYYATGTSSFDSGLDEFAVYDSVLSLARIQAHAAAFDAPVLLGDLNGDGFVDIDDINVLGSFWGQTVEQGNPAQGDPSNDGFVGAADLDIVRANWGNSTSSGSSVPEPSMLMLLATAAAAGLLRRFPTRIAASTQNTSERM